MQTWVALLRGINVGGRNVLPMARLRALLEALHCRDVRTYIQSGNAVFTSKSKSRPNLTKKILDAIEQEFGFRPTLLLLTATDFAAALDHNPFPRAAAAPKTLHYYFLDSVPKSPDTDALAALAIRTERYRLVGRVFYLHTPDGFGSSKLAANAERKLGVPATARNHATIEKIAVLLADP